MNKNMRTYKFRAKESLLGYWVYAPNVWLGSNKVDENGSLEHVIIENTNCDRKTLGQFTGLCDHNGKEVYEGDIIRIPQSWSNNEIVGEVLFDNGGFCVKSNRSGTLQDLAWAIKRGNKNEPRTEVIGNKFDNPELLEIR